MKLNTKKFLKKDIMGEEEGGHCTMFLGHEGDIFKWNYNSELFITTIVSMKPKVPTQNKLNKA